jgi:UPF0716 family protein affecting phage T7 exclusion
VSPRDGSVLFLKKIQIKAQTAIGVGVAVCIVAKGFIGVALIRIKGMNQDFSIQHHLQQQQLMKLI